MTTSTFVVLTGDEKHDVINPEVIGPFQDLEAARSWVGSLGNAVTIADGPFAGEIVLHPPDGGYAGFAFVNADTATSPEDYEDWAAEEEE